MCSNSKLHIASFSLNYPPPPGTPRPFTHQPTAALPDTDLQHRPFIPPTLTLHPPSLTYDIRRGPRAYEEDPPASRHPSLLGVSAYGLPLARTPSTPHPRSRAKECVVTRGSAVIHVPVSAPCLHKCPESEFFCPPPTTHAHMRETRHHTPTPHNAVAVLLHQTTCLAANAHQRTP